MKLGLKYKNEERIFEEKEKNKVPYLSYPLFENTGLVNHGFSTRLGGVSTGCWYSMNISAARGDSPEHVAENRKRIAQAIGVREEDFTYTNQTHTTNVAVAREEDRGKQFLETDGIVTDVPGICLVTFFADCVPLYFVDPVKKAVGLSHSGWRGTAGKIGRVTVEKMKEEFGSNPEDILAAVGPSICQDCYEVSGDVIERFQEVFDRSLWRKLFYPVEPLTEHDICGIKERKYQLNLWEANRQIFLEAGIKEEHIAVTNLCTCCNPELLFSHRAAGNRRGNLSAFLGLKE
ncbi:MAG: peptidoglycan editing factor PgeF [Dorea sp.]|nr:peptidoglycan editing factor PgeF [Dorea sp.]